MRFIIYGAGAIGGVIGGQLGRTGQEVVLIGRLNHVRAIREQGLRLVTPTGTHILPLAAVTGPEQVSFRADDVVFLTMKGQNTEAALRDLTTVTRDVPIFCFQNGVRNEEIAAQFSPRVYGVMERLWSVYLTDGEVTARDDPPGRLIIGCYPRGIDELAEAVADKLRSSGFLVMLTPDIMPYKWGKLMGNLANAISAITNAQGNDVDVIARATRKELNDLLNKAGIHWISMDELSKQWPDSVASHGRLDSEALSSTWQSLARQRGSVETEFLNGEVVRLAEKLGQHAPVNGKLLQLTQEMAAKRERPGKYTPVQLRKLLGLD